MHDEGFPLNRRRFLKTAMQAGALLAVPYVIPGTVLGKDGGVAPSERIVLGGIGIGGRGGYDLGCFLHEPDVQFVAVCDVKANRRKAVKEMVDAKYGNRDCATYIDMRELLARSDIDAVLIATGDNWHSGASILAARPPDLEVTVDGERTVLRRVNNLSIVKNPHLASGLRLDLDLGPADGSLYVVAVCGRSPAGMLGLVPGFYTGRVVDAPGVFVRRCREVTVASADRCEVEFDGDPRGFLPVRAGILPRGLRLLGGSR